MPVSDPMRALKRLPQNREVIRNVQHPRAICVRSAAFRISENDKDFEIAFPSDLGTKGTGATLPFQRRVIPQL